MKHCISHIKSQKKQPACTFSLRACGAAEGAVFIFDEMATENNVLASLGIFTANPDGRHGNRIEKKIP